MPTTYGNDIVYCLKSHCGVRGYCRQKWVLQVQIICKFSNERTCKRNKDVQGLSCGFEDNKKGIELKSVLCQTILNCYSIVTSSIQRYAGVLSPYIGSTSDPSKLNFTLCTSATLISQYVHVVTGDTVGLSYR